MWAVYQDIHGEGVMYFPTFFKTKGAALQYQNDRSEATGHKYLVEKIVLEDW